MHHVSRHLLHATVAALSLAPGRLQASAWPSRCGDPSAAAATHLAVRGSAMPTLADIYALDRQLAATGRPPLPHALLTYGADLVAQRGWLVLEGTADVVASRRVANARYVAATGGALDEATLGVALLCARAWAIYPLAGIGSTRLDLGIASRTAATVDSVLAGGATGGALSSRTLFDDYGVGLDYRGDEGGGSRLTAGLRLGYVERFGRARWKLSGQPVAGGPKYGLSGPYVRAGIGLGF